MGINLLIMGSTTFIILNTIKYYIENKFYNHLYIISFTYYY